MQRLWRRGPDGYVAVAPNETGRLVSETLGREFALEEGEVRLYTRDGELLLSHVETEAAWREAEAGWQEAETAREAEVQRRQEAELARQAAEARVADLERQLAALRARPDE